ncbi:MAG: hypothetical protein C0403_16500 [Desulfobacterium sp.]|nr:hypothetical protein [Desulfobacterium sp.]
MATILITDDEKNVRDVMSKMLFMMGHKIVSVSNGFEALRLFCENQIDLVITDLDMPVMDGWILAGRIKQKSPNMPILMVTGDRSTVKTIAAKHAHVDSIIYKPFKIESLKQAVERLLCFDCIHQVEKTSNISSAYNNAYTL